MQYMTTRTVDDGTRQRMPGDADGFRGAVVEMTDAVEDVVQASDAALRVLQAMTGRLAGVPFTLLAGHESMPGMLSSAWINTSVELIDIAVSAQRLTSDRTVAVHRRLVEGYLDAGSVLVGLTRTLASEPVEPVAEDRHEGEARAATTAERVTR